LKGTQTSPYEVPSRIADVSSLACFVGRDPAMAIAPSNIRSENTVRRSFAPSSNAMRAAALIEREEILLDEFRLVGEASYRRRQDIEVELSDIRRGLELLGFPRLSTP
jgi:hypothetical protein